MTSPTPDSPAPATIDFSMIVMSFGTSALINLGLAENPISGEKLTDLEGAKETIEMLAVIQEKTKGNLNEEEEHLLDKLLFDLRMAYVNAMKQKA